MRKRIFVILALSLVGVIVLSGIGVGAYFIRYPLLYKDEITEAAERFDLPPELIASVIRAESRFFRYAWGSSGEVGLMQLMPSTAAWLAIKMGSPGLEKKLNIPRVNITFGVFYLRMLYDRFGDVQTVLIAYNAGPTKAARWLKDPEHATFDGERYVLRSSPYPSTNAYVDRILNARRHYRWRF